MLFLLWMSLASIWWQACRVLMIPVNNVTHDISQRLNWGKKTFKMHFINRLCLRFMLMPALIFRLWRNFLFVLSYLFFHLYRKLKLFHNTKKIKRLPTLLLWYKEIVLMCSKQRWIMTQEDEPGTRGALKKNQNNKDVRRIFIVCLRKSRHSLFMCIQNSLIKKNRSINQINCPHEFLWKK